MVVWKRLVRSSWILFLIESDGDVFVIHPMQQFFGDKSVVVDMKMRCSWSHLSRVVLMYLKVCVVDTVME